MENTCLLIIFWGGMAEPFRSRIPYWVPEESLEDYINLALNLSGSAFRVDLAASVSPQSLLQSPLRSRGPQSPHTRLMRQLRCLLTVLLLYRHHPSTRFYLCLQALFLYMGLAFFLHFDPDPVLLRCLLSPFCDIIHFLLSEQSHT